MSYNIYIDHNGNISAGGYTINFKNIALYDAAANILYDVTGDQIMDISKYIKDISSAASNILTLDNTTPYTPIGPYNPSTKQYVDQSIIASGSVIKTTGFLQITNNQVALPTTALGDIIHNMGIIFNDTTSNVIINEVFVTTDGTNVYFDPNDNLNNKYCIVSYLTNKV